MNKLGYYNKYEEARKVLSAAKELLDVMDSTPGDFVNVNDLDDLYDELVDIIPMLQMAISNKTIEDPEMF